MDAKLIDCIFKLIRSTKLEKFKSNIKLDFLPNNFLKLFEELHLEMINNIYNLRINNNAFKSLIFLCEALKDFSYELLNIGKWFKVNLNIRYFYGLLTLYKVCIIIKFQIAEQNVLELLEILDNGLIYCPPFENNILAKLATILHDYAVKIHPITSSNYNLTYFKSTEEFLHFQVPRIRDISIEDFYEKFFKPKFPVIIEGLVGEWPAVSDKEHKWTVKYLLNKAAYRTVPIEIGHCYSDNEWTQKLMKLKDFINEYIINNQNDSVGYCAQYELFDRIENLSDDFYIPDFCCLMNNPENTDKKSCHIDINAWFGPKGTVSPLHSDPKDNLLSQVFGCKYIRLYSSETPIEKLYLYKENLLNNTSRVNIENINFHEFPDFPKTYLQCYLKEGDMLYIPKGYWHFVKSLAPSFSISFWWE